MGAEWERDPSNQIRPGWGPMAGGEERGLARMPSSIRTGMHCKACGRSKAQLQELPGARWG
eukprot:11727282-Alexandrium_andersonii.AAC.1